MSFLAVLKKLDSILGIGKPIGDMEGLGFNENSASASHTTFVHACDQPKNVTNPEPKIGGPVRQRSTRRRSTVSLGIAISICITMVLGLSLLAIIVKS